MEDEVLGLITVNVLAYHKFKVGRKGKTNVNNTEMEDMEKE